MKSLSVKLGVVIIGLLIFGYAEAWGADWRSFADSEGGTFFYDVGSITRPSKNIIRVWIKQVYTEKAIVRMVDRLGSRFENSEYSLDLWEFNCFDKMCRLLSSTAYSKNGQVLESFNPDTPKWNFLPPESVTEILFKAVCK